MVTHPANMVMTIVPRVVACFASFERIQNYLLASEGIDPRQFPTAESSSPSPNTSGPAIRLRHATSSALSANIPVLRDINFEIGHGQLIVCRGAVGSGKSLLARMILGEVPLTHGSVEVSSRRIGFCGQTPWLPDGTVRDAICASVSEVDVLLYKTAIHSCCLDYDITSFADGDETPIGSRGMSLSGGQRQRLVITLPTFSFTLFSQLIPMSNVGQLTYGRHSRGWYMRVAILSSLMIHLALWTARRATRSSTTYSGSTEFFDRTTLQFCGLVTLVLVPKALSLVSNSLKERSLTSCL